MSLLADVVPQVRAATWPVRIVGALLAAGVVIAIFWWVFLHPIEQATQVAQSKVDATLGDASTDIATNTALPIIADTQRQHVQVDVAVQKGTIDVRQASDAATSVAGVSAAVVRGNCLLPTLYQSDAACESVREAAAVVGPVGPDSGSAARPD